MHALKGSVREWVIGHCILHLHQLFHFPPPRFGKNREGRGRGTNVDSDELEHSVLGQDGDDDLPATLLVYVNQRKPPRVSLLEEFGGFEERFERVNGEEGRRRDLKGPLDLFRT